METGTIIIIVIAVLVFILIMVSFYRRVFKINEIIHELKKQNEELKKISDKLNQKDNTE